MALSKISEFFSLQKTNSSNLTIAILIVVAVVFGFVCRLYYLSVFSPIEEMRFNDQLMINTNDGYFWAEGARDLIENPPFADELSPKDRALPQITAFLAKIFPFISFETLILFMPAVIAPLIAIPIVLIGRSLGSAASGFFASLIAVIAWSYYNRTTIGYYDDDMLTIVLPIFVLYLLIAGAVTKKDRYLILCAIAAPISIWYYANSQLIIFGMAGMLALYTIVKRDFDSAKLLTFLMIGLFSFSFAPFISREYAMIISFAFSGVMFIIYLRFASKINDKRIIISALVIFTIAALYFSNVFLSFWWQFSSYITRQTTSIAQGKEIALNFLNVAQTVREAGEIPFSEFANRISGHQLLFLLSCLGTIALMFAYPITLISMPFIAMGFMAYGIPGLINGGGLRFTIYAVPIMALGLSFLFVWLNDLIANRLDIKNKIANYTFRRYKAIAFLFIIVALLPHLAHIKEYLTPTVFYKTEVLALNDLKDRIEKRKDYAISWWDYGFPFRYYAYAKTLADGAKHGGADNYAPSFILTTDSQTAAANMSRLAVEYTEKQIADRNYTGIISMMMSDYNSTNPNRFIKSLSDRIELPEKTREIYIVLPHRMSQIFSTVMSFSTRDLSNGKKLYQPIFAAGNLVKTDKEMSLLDNGIAINHAKGSVIIGQGEIKIKYEFLTGYENGAFFRRANMVHSDGLAYLIFLRHTGEVWVLDEKTFRSTFVQLFALENFDSDLFERILSNPMIKIYRVKI